MKTYSYINEQKLVQLIKLLIKKKKKKFYIRIIVCLYLSQLFGQDNIPQFCK